MAFSLAAIFPLFSSIADTPTPDIGASDSTANCDSGVLHSTTGPTAFQAEWSANTININWFADSGTDSAISLTNSAAGTCTYDGAITLPTNTLNKTGYTFAGWQVRQAAAQSCFAGVDTSIDGTATGSLPLSGATGVRAATYGLTQPGKWATEFSYGIIRGISSCNTTSMNLTVYNNTVASATNDNFVQLFNTMWENEESAKKPDGTFNSNYEGQYCWCQVTSYTPNSGSACSITSPSWVFYIDLESVPNCASYCAVYCSETTEYFSGFRAALYGVTQ